MSDEMTIIVSAGNQYSNYSPVYLKDEELNQVYDELVKQMNKKIYDSYSNLKSIKDKMADKIEDFLKLDMFKKIYVLTEVIKLLSCNRFTADLLLIDMSKGCGVLRISKNNFSGKIITESITGYYTKVIYDSEKEWDTVQL